MKKPTVVISILGGVVEIEKMPDNINVIVQDYDVENYDSNDDRLHKNKYGRYIKREFGNEFTH